MTKFSRKAAVVTLLIFSWARHGLAMELATTSQFVVQGSTTYRSLDPPPAFLVQPSPFGRPVFITTGPPSARLLDPKHAHRREYWAQVERVPDAAALSALRAGGIDLGGYRTLPCEVRMLVPTSSVSGCKVRI